jgi:signal transduction histidine kinase/CheY-like chemotaxis protein
MGELYDLEIPPNGVVPLDRILDRIHPDDRQKVLSRRELVRTPGTTVQHEHRVVRGDGSTRYVRGASVTVASGDAASQRVVGVTMDVTDATLAELERVRLVHDLGERVKELRLLHAVAVAAQRPWASAQDLLQHVANVMPPAWQYPDAAEARITLGDIVVTTPGWRETPWRVAVSFEVQGDPGSIEVVYTEQKPELHDGPFLKEEHDLLISLGDFLGTILVSLRTRRELEHLVETRTAELRAARDAAEQAAKAKGAFLANMSHEIRTPMNAILGYEQLLQAEAGLTDEQRRKLDVIRTSGDHLLGLINDILEMSRIEAGRTALSVQPFDFRALVDGVQSMFTGQVSKRGISLDVHVDAAVPRGIRADPGKVRQVMINLIGNAVKFTDAGGVRVRVSATPVGDTQSVVSIAVEDTGPGIDASEFDMIFSAFGQAKLGASRGGTGLGLPISRSFARLMDGDITVSSKKGRGSTFTFTFTGTVVEAELVPTLDGRQGRRSLAPTERSRRVLVVDDVPINRDLLQESLTRAGFDTRPAASGEDALNEHEAWKPDLIVMDVHMPGIGGVEAIRLLRARGATTPVIISTASVDADLESKVFAAGAQRLLSKPHREQQLFDAIAAVLNVEFVAEEEARRPRSTPLPAAPLRNVVHEIPAPLVAELREAARKARAGRVLELADEVAEHSPAAAQSIRQLADEFRYAALIDALQGAPVNA